MPQLPPPRVARLPLTVGVHYPASFLRAKHEEKTQPIWYMHEPGGASAALFDGALAATFEKVIQIPAWPPASGEEPDVALVLVPRVAGLSTLDGYITYEITFYTPAGVRQGTWMINANADVSWFASHDSFSALVLRGAAAQLLIGLRERPELTAHLAARDALPGKQSYGGGRVRNPGIALVPRVSGDDGWMSCMEDGLREGAPTLRFIESERFRDALFPWFEPSVQQPATPEAWAKRLSEPAISDNAVQIGATYVLFIGGHTENGPMNGSLSCGGGPGAMGCFGFTTGARLTKMRVTLVDLARKELVGDVEVSESGSFSWLGVVLPIPIISATEADACRRALDNVLGLLDGR
ncbi:MAG TPA: hypothetical protein VD839_00175 [Burkholderiales bacterium]|nr:hypothetical protein [Burkholderiales bacterium]